MTQIQGTNLKQDDESKARGKDQPELRGERIIHIVPVVSVAANTMSSLVDFELHCYVCSGTERSTCIV